MCQNPKNQENPPFYPSLPYHNPRRGDHNNNTDRWGLCVTKKANQLDFSEPPGHRPKRSSLAILTNDYNDFPIVSTIQYFLRGKPLKNMKDGKPQLKECGESDNWLRLVPQLIRSFVPFLTSHAFHCTKFKASSSLKRSGVFLTSSTRL